MRRLALLLTVSTLAITITSCGGNGEPARPNFLIIVTDDQRYDTVGEFMPETQARIFDDGLAFDNAVVTTPLCCPSRASILTGMYAHTHAVHINSDELDRPTFPQALSAAGYTTGIVGKYLNSWDSQDPPRPEFDYWAVTSGGGEAYVNAAINVDGELGNAPGYITDALLHHALGFLDTARNEDAPFLLIFAPNAPHLPAEPGPGDEALYADLPPHRPPSHNEPDLTDKPTWGRRPPLDDEAVAALDTLRLNQLRSLASLDRAISRLLDDLEDAGELDDTVVIFISDNGHFWGEHRLDGKVLPYEEAVRVPFAVRYPAAFPTAVEGRIVANIDIAPTVYALAGLNPPERVDGRPLLELADDPEAWREDILIEAWPGQTHYTAVRTERFVYIEQDGQDDTELYDLQADPFQLENVADDPARAPLIETLRARLEVLRGYRSGD